MAWWKHSDSIRFSPIVSEILRSNNNNGYGLAREAIFYKLLSLSVENVPIYSCDHLAKLLCAPSKQAQIVWDVCLKHHVLRQINDFFSAIEWMGENHLLMPKTESAQKAPTPKKNIVTKSSGKTPITSEPIEESKKEVEPQQNDSVIKYPEDKELVRPNVKLTRNEIQALRERYSDEQISQMLDILSTYKTTSGRYYASDYAAITRWVSKKIDNEISKLSMPEEFPTWVYGKG